MTPGGANKVKISAGDECTLALEALGALAADDGPSALNLSFRVEQLMEYLPNK